MRIRARAIRRCGELLNEFEAEAHRGKKGVSSETHLSERAKAADQAGLSDRQKITALRLANVPHDSFELQVESPKPPTVTALAEQPKVGLFSKGSATVH